MVNFKHILLFEDLLSNVLYLIGWLCLTSHRQRGHLLSLAKDVKLDKYTVPTGI